MNHTIQLPANISQLHNLAMLNLFASSDNVDAVDGELTSGSSSKTSLILLDFSLTVKGASH